MRRLTTKYSIDSQFSSDGIRVFNTVSGEEIPEDEPLFLLRARDHLAIKTLFAYISLCIEDNVDDKHVAALNELIEDFQQFRREHPERIKQPGITRDVKLRAEN